MKKKKWMGSVFLQYVFSYFGIVLLSCAILGMVFVYSTIKAVDEQNRQVAGQKMKLALQDLETQCGILEDIASDILLHNEFNPSFFQESKYNEIELVESLGKYISYSPYTSTYFLLYSNSDIVYQSTGHISYFSYYAPNILKTTGSKALYAKIIGITHFTVLDYGDDELFLFAMPVNVGKFSASSVRATLSFVVSKSRVQERLREVSGLYDVEFSVYMGDDGLCLTGDNLSAQEFADLGEGCLVEKNESYGFTMYLNYEGKALHSLPWNSRLNLVFFFVFLILSLALILFFATFTYRPIRRLMLKYANEDESGPKNEFTTFDTLLETAQEKRKFVDEQISRITRTAKNQMILLLISGDYTDSMKNRMRLSNVHLSEPYFGVHYVRLLEDVNESVCHQMADLIEDLSVDGIYLYAMAFPEERGIVVLFNAAHACEEQDIRESIVVLFEAEQLDVEIGQGRVCKELSAVQLSYLEAKTSCQSMLLQQGETVYAPMEKNTSQNGPLQYDGKRIIQMMNAVRHGKAEEACTSLRAFLDELKAEKPSEFRMRFIFSDILSKTVALAQSLAVPVTEAQISQILCARNDSGFYEGMQQFLICICDGVQREKGVVQQDKAKKIVDYILLHYRENDFSLESLAENLGMSVSGVNRVLKKATNLTYRDFLISIRMEEAKRLLAQEGMSVADTARYVGYTNISHFIKTFKTIVGVLPSNYAKGNF